MAPCSDVYSTKTGSFSQTDWPPHPRNLVRFRTSLRRLPTDRFATCAHRSAHQFVFGSRNSWRNAITRFAEAEPCRPSARLSALVPGRLLRNTYVLALPPSHRSVFAFAVHSFGVSRGQGGQA